MAICTSWSTPYKDLEVLCSVQSAGSIYMEGADRREAAAFDAAKISWTPWSTPCTIIALETCQRNLKFETVILVAKELNIGVDTAIFLEMVNKEISKTVVDFFARKSEAEIEKNIAICKQAGAFQKDE